MIKITSHLHPRRNLEGAFDNAAININSSEEEEMIITPLPPLLRQKFIESNFRQSLPHIKTFIDFRFFSVVYDRRWEKILATKKKFPFNPADLLASLINNFYSLCSVNWKSFDLINSSNFQHTQYARHVHSPT
jgi:hypothetical protein